MYSIAKLLSDEPKKLEIFILTLLKVLCTVWIAQNLFDFNPDWANFSVETFFKNFRVDESLYFVLIAFGIWYLLWELLIDVVVDLLIELLSLIGNPENTLKWYLWFTMSIKKEKDIIIDSKPNIIYFTESIKDNNGDSPFIITHSRANQIFSVGLVSFILLLNSEISLSNWQIIIAVFLILNFLAISAIQRKLHNYYYDHQDAIRSYYYPLGQFQKIKNVLQQCENFNKNYDLKVHRKRIILKQTKPIDFLPDEIVVLPRFFNNTELGARILEEEGDELFKRIEKNKLSIICSNYCCTEKQLTRVNERTYCIYGDDQDDLYKGFEELIHYLRRSYYSETFSEDSEEANGLSEE